MSYKVINSIDKYISKNRVFITVVAFLYFLPLLTASETSSLRTLLHTLTLIFAYGMLAMSFDLQLARSGLLNFGQALLFGVGAYTLAFSLITDLLPFPLNLIFSIPYPFSLLLAVVVGIIVGGIMGTTTDRLRGTGFAFIALAIAMLVFNYFKTNSEISGGETGLVLPIPPFIKSQFTYLLFAIGSVLVVAAFIFMVVQYITSRLPLNPFDYQKVQDVTEKSGTFEITNLKIILFLGGMLGIGVFVFPNIISLFFTSRKALFTIPVQYYLSLTSMVLTYLFIQRLTISPFGRVITAIAQNEERVQALGYNTYRYKIITVAIAGGIAALSGVLFAQWIRTIDPHSALGVEIAIDAMIYTIVGGLGTLIGPFLGAGVVAFSELRLVDLIEDIFPGFGEWWLVVLGIIYVIIVLFFPHGIVGSLQLRSRSLKESGRKFRIYEHDYWIYALIGSIFVFLIMFTMVS